MQNYSVSTPLQWLLMPNVPSCPVETSWGRVHEGLHFTQAFNGALLSMAEQPDKEEQYLLRVQDKDLAEKLSKILRQPASTTPPSLELKFTSKLN